MCPVNNSNRVSKIWVLTLDPEQTAISEILSEPGTKVSKSRTARGLKCPIIRIRITDIRCERCAGSASAANAAVKDCNIDLRQAKAKLIEQRRLKGVRIGNTYLPRVSNFITRAESCRGK